MTSTTKQTLTKHELTTAVQYPCDGCGESIVVGSTFAWLPGKGFFHMACSPHDAGNELLRSKGPVLGPREVITGLVAGGGEDCVLCGGQLGVRENALWVNHRETTDPGQPPNGMAHYRCANFVVPEKTSIDNLDDLRRVILEALPGLTEDDFRDQKLELTDDTYLFLSNQPEENLRLGVFVNGSVEVSEAIADKAEVGPFLAQHVLPRLHRAWAIHTAAVEHLERVLSLCEPNDDERPSTSEP
jgi:hypothetical protein